MFRKIGNELSWELELYVLNSGYTRKKMFFFMESVCQDIKLERRLGEKINGYIKGCGRRSPLEKILVFRKSFFDEISSKNIH